jgi:hypothetical protein
MKKIVITFGLISGAIVSMVMLGSMPLWKNGIINFENGQWVGYTSMVIALSMVFVGIKSYRDNHQQGAISFGKGFRIGILITLIASVMYSLSWEVSYRVFAPDFIEKWSQHYMEQKEKEGASTATLEKVKEEMEQLTKMYKNPLVRFGMTLMEIFPVGLVITLVSAGVLRKKEILPAH